MTRTPGVALVAFLSVAALLDGLVGSGFGMGMFAVFLVALLCAVALTRRDGTSWRVYAYLWAFAVIFCLLLALISYLHRPDLPLRALLGFPAATALLVYGVVPLGLTMGVFYGLVFDRHILPEKAQREFLDRFGRK